MGGHHSKVTSSQTTSVVSGAMQSLTQDCTAYVDAKNQIVMSGDGDVVGDVSQRLRIKVDRDCANKAAQSSQLTNNIKDAVSQSLSDKGVALTQFMDNSKTTVASTVNELVSNTSTSAVAQGCVSRLDGGNIINASGRKDVAARITQDYTGNFMLGCVASSSEMSKTLSGITNAANQHSVYTSENPLNFIADSIRAVGESIIAAAALLVIILVCFVFLFKFLRRKKRAANASQSPQAVAVN